MKEDIELNTQAIIGLLICALEFLALIFLWLI